MQRILIMGGPGSGKSRLARAMGARLDLKVAHLDSLNFYPGWVETETEVFRAGVAAAVSGDRWVSDGNYVSKTADIRLARADAIVWIDQPRWLRMVRVVKRTLFTPPGGRPDMAEGCDERFDRVFLTYAWTFETKKRAQILERVTQMAPHVPVTYLRGDRGVSAFLAGLGAD